MDVFDRIPGQPKIRDLLRASCAAGKVSHAYLFVGPMGSGKLEAALALAQFAVCLQGGCGECEECRSALRRNHPDVHVLEPEGASGYLIEQIRELIGDVSLTPMRAKKKVYIIDRADALGDVAANSFLKTLEEPPSDTMFILLARTREGVLPTIASRCQLLVFRQVSTEKAIAAVCEQGGISSDCARGALEACGGSIRKAVEFGCSEERLAFRQQVIKAFDQISRADCWTVMRDARQLLEQSTVPVNKKKELLDARLSEVSEFLGSAALRRLEDQNKRAVKSASVQCMRQLTAIIRSLLRDVLLIREQASDLVTNVDAIAITERLAKCVHETEIVAAVQAVDYCDTMIAYNVNQKIAVETLFLELRALLAD